LEVRPRAIALTGASKGRTVERAIPLDSLRTIRVGRSQEDRLDGRCSLVLERRTGSVVRVASVAQPGIVSELAQRLAGLQLGGEGATQRALVVVPLKEGSLGRARELVEAGPPFDPEHTALARHHVFLLGNEALFLFEADPGDEKLEDLLRVPNLWRAASAWQELVAGPPQIAEDVFSWERQTPMSSGNGAGELSFDAIPGPRDSEGGDLFAP
jgi:hypothetical protein